MDWQLLLTAIGVYTVVYLIGMLALIPCGRYQLRLFRERFPGCEDVNELSAAERAEWDSIIREKYDRSGYRSYEIAWTCFNYPSIIMLSAILRRPSLGVAAMYLVTGVTYVMVFYLLWR